MAASTLRDQLIFETPPLLIQFHHRILPTRCQYGTLSSDLGHINIHISSHDANSFVEYCSSTLPPVYLNCLSVWGYCLNVWMTRSFPLHLTFHPNSRDPGLSQSQLGIPWPVEPAKQRKKRRKRRQKSKDTIYKVDIQPLTQLYKLFWLIFHVRVTACSSSKEGRAAERMLKR